MALTALSGECEHDSRSRHTGMTVAQRRQAERPVRAPVRVIANAYRGAIAVARVVLRLLSPFGIASCCLEVASRVRADPHISPRWRNGQRPNSLQIGGDDLAATAAVVKPLGAAARYTLGLVVRETKTRSCCHCLGSGRGEITRARWAQEHLRRETRQHARENPDQSRVAASISLVDPTKAAGLASLFAPLQDRLVRCSRSDERFRRS